MKEPIIRHELANAAFTGARALTWLLCRRHRLAQRAQYYLRLLGGVGLLLASATASAGDNVDRQTIEHEVARLVELFSDGIAVAYPEYRSIRFGRLFNDEETAKEDVAVIFNVEGFHGGNYHAEFLAFFAAVRSDAVAGQKTKPHRLVAVTQIGGRGYRSFDQQSLVIKDGGVVMHGKEWRDSDPACCPSQPFTSRFTVEEGAIVETPVVAHSPAKRTPNKTAR